MTVFSIGELEANVNILILTAEALALLCCLPILLRARSSLRETTLITACNWALAVAVAWTSVWTFDSALGCVPTGTADQLWYALAVLSLSPAVAVLGARRPISRVWPWFVLGPMILILIWPALVDWSATSRGRALELEEPAIVGFLLVLIMAAGNYLGTRYRFSALLLITALALLVAPLMIGFPKTVITRDTARLAATACFAAAILARQLPHGSPRTLDSPFDRLWHDFRNEFGLVWARRVQDRINIEAQKENWPLKLEIHGFIWNSGSIDAHTRTQTEARLEHHIRWLFRRFVSEAWLDQYLNQTAPTTPN